MTAEHDERQVRDTLDYIRDTMQSASSFTAISGWGLIAVGIIGIAAAGVAQSRGLGTDLALWIPTAIVAVVVSALFTADKARRIRVPLWSGSFRKLAWVMVPPLLAGTILTVAMAPRSASELLAGTWLVLYGAGVAAGATFSVRAFRWMGLLFLVLGAATLFEPEWSVPALGIGFGGIHVLFGVHLVRRYGG